MFFRFFFLIVILTSCTNNENTFFGGKILNPSSDKISLYKNDILIDESIIDSSGNFQIFIDSINSGLFNFYHDPEFQYIILEKNDSLKIRLNTLDFDESLVYTGSGSGKNNFLMDVFLRSEQDEDFINSNLNLKFDEFKRLVDSLYTDQFNSFNTYLFENEISILSQDIISSAILYPYLSKIHSFIIRNNISPEEQFILFKPYNSNIDFNLKFLGYFKPYIDFIYLDIYNRVKNEKKFNSLVEFNQKRLIKTDEIITSYLVKERVLRFHAVGFLLQKQHDSINRTFLKTFTQVSKNESINKEIFNLYESLKE